MKHTVHPFAHRLNVLRDWRSRWFGNKKHYKEFFHIDLTIRNFLETKLRTLYVSSVEIEQQGKMLRIIIKSARPGLLIGRQGEGTVALKRGIETALRKKGLTSPEIRIDIEEVRSPEADASVVASMVVEGLEKRLPFRRVLKQTMEKVMANRDVKGAKIQISGRLGGAEMSRSEELKKGMLPLQTIRADIDFSRKRARLPYGILGVKTWIYKGEVFSQKPGLKK